MGIPHLISYLQPYAVNTAIDNAHVVIDGPGLAFHLHHVCSGLNAKARGPFEAQPSYELIARAIIDWLDQLEQCGARIVKIYFDGFLPPSKRSVRIERLVQYSNQLRLCHQKSLTAVRIAENEFGLQSPEDLFRPRASYLSTTKLPAAPFLVPAVIEALLGSEKYRECVRVVPAEADLFCAKYARESEGPITILTGDSDLLAQDIGSAASVCLFRDMTCSGTMSSSVKFIQFHPSIIADRIELPRSYGLRALAFEMIMDQHATFPQLINRAKDLKSVNAHQAMYAQFIKDYDGSMTTGEKILTLTESKDVFSTLDPRTSELTLQFLCPVLPIESSVDYFPPFAIDSRLKTSAWEIGTTIRTISYSLLRSISPDGTSSVSEHRRSTSTTKGKSGSTGKLVEIPAEAVIIEACSSISQLIERGTHRQSNLDDLWIMLSMSLEIQWMLAEERQPWTADARRLAKQNGSSRPKMVDWDMIHFVMQLQCSYYSLRVLKQILEVYKSLQPEDGIPRHIAKLCELLVFLPPLRKIPSISQLARRLSSSESLWLYDAAYELLGVERVMEEERLNPKKKRKKSKMSGPGESPLPTKRSANPFDILTQE